MNKSDLVNEIVFGLEDMQEVASRYNAKIVDSLPKDCSTSYSTSAKVGDNVENLFESLGHLMLSDETPSDPIKDLYESLVAMGVERQTDKETAIGALDAIIVDFCEGFEDDRVAMSMLRQEIVRAGIDIRSPSKAGLLMVVEYLAEAESEYKDAEEVNLNKDRRMQLARSVRE